MAKIIGAILLILCCGGFGYFKGNQCGQRVNQLMELAKITEFLKGEIAFSRTTLPEALERIGKKTAEPFAEFLLELSKSMKTYSGEGFAELLKIEMEKYLKNSFLEKEDLENFYQAYRNLGYLDKEMQIHILERYIKEQERLIDMLSQQLPAQKKLFHSLGVLGGIFLTIILI
ncbi:MAG: stage III sporulation protein AB [Ruminococcus sp.]|nr:stage III sporulation protein AB [Ruminococcus sp.]